MLPFRLIQFLGRSSMAGIGFRTRRHRLWMPLSLLLILAGYGRAAGELRLAREPVAVHAQDVDYLQIGGKSYQATVYQQQTRKYWLYN